MLDDYQTIALRFPVAVRVFKEAWGWAARASPRWARRRCSVSKKLHQGDQVQCTEKQVHRTYVSLALT